MKEGPQTVVSTEEERNMNMSNDNSYLRVNLIGALFALLLLTLFIRT